ncbi:MFS transporter [Pseudomonas chlororaphis]|uniref:MFS transporter n=1 Tax=Pseudomonas chlororaphis TaxID=587753 RepID=A0A1Q8EPN7_9PSED|nr:MFS transporter [Pseudomonas chlororaphis]OLF53755.1 MFS transporter [Pseudomonas chlororaphis]
MPAPTLAGERRSHAFVFCLALSLMVALMNSSAPTPLYPLYGERLGLGALDLTLIFGAYGVGVLVALIAMARLAGNLGDLRRVFVPASLLVALGAAAFAHGAALGPLCVARLLAGLGSGAMTAAVNVALVRFNPGHNEKLPALVATLAMVSGLALGPLVSGAALQLDIRPLAAPFWLVAVLGLALAAATLLLWPAGGTPPPAPEHPRAASLREALLGIGRPFHLCAWSVFFSWSFAACVFVIGPQVAQQVFGLEDRGVFGYVVSAYLLVAGLSQLYCQRLDARQALLGGWWCQCLALLVLLLACYTRSLYLALAGLAIGGYAYGALFVGNARLVNQLAPRHGHATLIAYFYATVYLFNATPLPLGLLVDAYGVVTASTVALCLFLGLALALFAAARRTRFAAR